MEKLKWVDIFVSAYFNLIQYLIIMKKFQVYESPSVEVQEIEMEQCFAMSPGSGDGTGTGSDWPGFGNGSGDGFGTGSNWPGFN